ncbi:hypothetical protein V6N11_004899 [Hibiscus sabdariffa]|uniref:RNase H type-1 domain-containing protein n=1 Tax=Hibiscus sabdariffa TaxID=183260 RepID=A0ABR2SID9_9ROSI
MEQTMAKFWWRSQGTGYGDGRVRTQGIDTRYTTVANLIDQPVKRWKYEILQDLFDDDQASSICAIPLARTDLADEIIWRFEGSGCYSAIWNLSLPSKVKITLWRITSNFLPTFDNLQRRRLNIRNTFNFPSAPNSVSDLWLEWLAMVFVNLSENRRRELAVTYWAVWFSRNKLVHEGYKSSIYEVSSFITTFICEQDSICMPNGNTRPIVVPRWEAPQEAAVKINFDSAFSCHSWSATSGIGARDNEGFILTACVFPHSNVSDAFVAEALACLQAVHFAKDMGFLNVTIEGDSLSVCKKLNSGSHDRSLIAPIISDIKELAVGFRDISFACVRREANKTAHSLAREYRSTSTPYCWIEEVPPGTATVADLEKRDLLPVQT